MPGRHCKRNGIGTNSTRLKNGKSLATEQRKEAKEFSFKAAFDLLGSKSLLYQLKLTKKERGRTIKLNIQAAAFTITTK